jgi:hypothetical protein
MLALGESVSYNRALSVIADKKEDVRIHDCYDTILKKLRQARSAR